MKRSSMLTVLATGLLAVMIASVADAQDGKMSGAQMPGMQMSGAASTQKEKLGHTTGKVIQIDAAQSRITIAHHPVPALGWPAMTMTFQATSQQLKGIKTGDQVDFEFYMKGTAAVIERIRKSG